MESVWRMEEMEEWFGDTILHCGVFIVWSYMTLGGVGIWSLVVDSQNIGIYLDSIYTPKIQYTFSSLRSS
jgi:hypothetical protein